MKQQISIRRAVAADTDAVRGIARAAYAKYVPRIGREPSPMLADFGTHIARDETVVIEVEGKVRGFMIAWPEPDAFLIENLAVDPVWQGQGLGRRLIDHAVVAARRLGLPAIRLYTNAAMTENLAMYRRIGFIETHRAMENGFNRVYMRWDFS